MITHSYIHQSDRNLQHTTGVTQDQNVVSEKKESAEKETFKLEI